MQPLFSNLSTFSADQILLLVVSAAVNQCQRCWNVGRRPKQRRFEVITAPHSDAACHRLSSHEDSLTPQLVPQQPMPLLETHPCAAGSAACDCRSCIHSSSYSATSHGAVEDPPQCGHTTSNRGPCFSCGA
ncbi:hypothetical protein AHAS_Ahas04G0133500 [Arachis hypogaea]